MLLRMKSNESRTERKEEQSQKLLALEERKFALYLSSEVQAAPTAIMKARVDGDRLKWRPAEIRQKNRRESESGG